MREEKGKGMKGGKVGGRKKRMSLLVDLVLGLDLGLILGQGSAGADVCGCVGCWVWMGVGARRRVWVWMWVGVGGCWWVWVLVWV